MRPEEKGRYCAACSKTVVDFSMMSDREIIGYLSRAGRHVCGRFAPDQLDRKMALASPAARGRHGWWHWLLAGLLVSAEANAQRQPVKAATHQTARLGSEKMIVGDTVTIGLEKIIPQDTINVQELPPVVVQGYRTMGKMDVIVGSVGGVFVGTDITPADSATQWIRDTLTTIGLLPKKQLGVYPNPVGRGSAVSLTWQAMEPGPYEIALFNSAGALIQQRMVQVDSKDQVDLLDVPSTLSAGVYFLRATPVGPGKTGMSAKPVTRKLVVL